ncbi:MAG TPA: MarR family transcriptional regulator, partial [Candidatus Limnocylindria bacterium]|nr:MarR family transcriptional regulator [Candidatus Limnocylindria bacterium]
LVVRRRDPEDARAVALHVTAAGKRLTRRIVPIADRYEKVALEGFARAEAEALRSALRRLYANMDELG